MGDLRALVGRRVRLVFDVVDATPDLPEFGPVTARLTRLDEDASVGAQRLVAVIEAPPELEGLTVVNAIRYEEESVTHAASGRPVTVNAQILDKAGQAIGGGIATMMVEKA